MANLGQAYVQIVPSAEGLAGSISKAIGGEADSAGKSAGLKIGDTIKKLIIGAGIGTAIKASLDEGAKLQQSYGGLETLYGEAAGAAKEYAAAAAQAGISANTYAEQAVSFGARLKQAFGGDATKAVEAANTAILDMADNAAKMGTPIESVQQAYQGFAKGQYQLLDNLKLGYGGTKTEMERLLADAQKITGVEYDINNLGDVYDAIHVIQGELGLTGVAANEAATTFSGSLEAMKAAGMNVLGNLSLGEDITPSLRVLGTSVRNFLLGNLVPMIGNILKSVPDLIGGVVGEIIGTINTIGQHTDEIVQTGIEIVTGLADAIITALPYLAEAGVNLVISLGQSLLSQDWLSIGTGMISSLASSLSTAAAEILGTSDPGQIMQMIGGGISKGLPMLLELGKQVITTVCSGISAMGAQLPTIMGQLGQMAVTLFRSIDWLGLGRAVLSYVITGITALGGSLGSVLRGIGQTALNLFRAIDWAGLGRTVLNFVINGIKAVGSNVASALRSIGTNALNAFKGINWSGIGRNIITGIVNGVKGAASSLYSSLKNIASNALNAAKNLLKIGSPSKLAAEMIGQWIPPGIAEGVESTADVLNDTMRDMALDSLQAADGFNIAYNAAPVGRPTSGAVIYNTFTINAPAGMDVHELADQVIERMTMAERQRAAVWGTA